MKPNAPNAPDDATVLAILRGSTHRPFHISEVAEALGLPLAARRALSEQLDALVTRGLVASMPGSRYRLPRERGVQVEGRFAQNPKGFGFVSAADGGADVFVPPTGILGAMHGDLVMVTAIEGPRGREGVVTEVLTRRLPRIPGVLRIRPLGAWVEADDARIRGPIPIESVGTGKDGEAVVCEIVRWPEHPGEVPQGIVRETLGLPGDLTVEVRKVLLREGVEEAFPEDASREADALPERLRPEDHANREDLRGIPLITIDPDDARDHDDAIHVARRDDGGYVATVAIADVSHYVTPGSALDAAALTRGTSIYLPDRAIPMLPHALSSHLASLLDHQDRLSLGVQVHVRADGVVESARLFEAVVRCRTGLTYTQVAKAMGWTESPADPEGVTAAEAVKPDLEAAADLAEVLRRRRIKRGALDFDLPEGRVRFAEDGRTPVDVYQSRQDPGIRKAYQLVEELMLLANETVAERLVKEGVPTLFRIHPQPDEELLGRFATVATAYGHKLDVEAGRVPKKLAALLKKIQGTSEARVLGMLLLRAMQQARYASINTGHFGLASEAYLHFTSPIRRYPDLVVHRAVRGLIRGDKSGGGAADASMARVAAETSRMERRAMEVEREVMDLYRCVVARDHMGEIHTGMIAGLSSAGPFVDLESPFISGLLRVEGLGPDAWQIDDLGIRMASSRTGHVFVLGDPITVEISDVALQRRTVYLNLTSEARAELRGKRKPPRKTGTLPKKKGARKGRR